MAANCFDLAFKLLILMLQLNYLANNIYQNDPLSVENSENELTTNAFDWKSYFCKVTTTATLSAHNRYAAGQRQCLLGLHITADLFRKCIALLWVRPRNSVPFRLRKAKSYSANIMCHCSSDRWRHPSESYPVTPSEKRLYEHKLSANQSTADS